MMPIFTTLLTTCFAMEEQPRFYQHSLTPYVAYDCGFRSPEVCALGQRLIQQHLNKAKNLLSAENEVALQKYLTGLLTGDLKPRDREWGGRHVYSVIKHAIETPDLQKSWFDKTIIMHKDILVNLRENPPVDKQYSCARELCRNENCLTKSCIYWRIVENSLKTLDKAITKFA